jgi:hypothetical protein
MNENVTDTHLDIKKLDKNIEILTQEDKKMKKL